MKTSILLKTTCRIVALIMMLGVMGLNEAYAYSFSAVCETGQTLYYNINGSNVTVTYPGSSTSSPWSGYTKPTGVLVIPNCVTYNNVTYNIVEIGQYAFYGCNNLTEITIGTGVTKINNYAFWACPALTTVHFNATYCTQMHTRTGNPATTGYQYYSVFNSGTTDGGTSAITVLTFGDNVQNIPSYAFRNAKNLLILTIPNYVSEIGSYAFYGCTNLAELTIGEGVQTINGYAFGKCPSLTKVHFNALNCNQMYTQTGSGTINSPYVYYSVFSRTSTAGSSAITTLTIGNNVTRIPAYAFMGCSGLSGVVIPNSVATIGHDSFYGCTNLAELTIGEGVTSIGGDAFGNCPVLAIVHFNATNCTQMSSVFSNTSSASSSAITTLTIGDNVTSIPDNAFKYSSGLNEVVIPSSVTTIGQYSFYGCTNLAELTIGEGVTSIGGYAFWSCPLLTTVHFDATNCTNMYTSINSGSNCSVFNTGDDTSGTSAITTITIGGNVTNIPAQAFRSCPNVTNISIPNSVVGIRKSAFYGCSGLTNVVIPNSVAQIGSYSFYGCTNLAELTMGQGLTIIGEYAFYGCSGIMEVVVPSSVATIGQYSFYGCTNLAELTIGEGVTSIGGYAFGNCPVLATVHFNATNCTQMSSVFSNTSSASSSAITTLTIGNNVTCIPNDAFRGCSGLSGAVIPSSVTTIGQHSFYGCTNLAELTIGEGVTSIGGYAFYGCTNLTELTMGQGLTIIGEDAFYGCSGIMEVVVPSSVETISSYAFYGCTNLVELTIGEGVQTIGGYAFWNCPALATVQFNATNCTQMNTYKSSIYYSVFSSTSSGSLSAITTLAIGNNVTRIPAYAFMGCSGLSGVVIPSSVATIGQYSFYGCTNLAELTIGEGVTSIGGYAFWNCPVLATVHFNATNCTQMSSVFRSTSSASSSAITTLTIGDNVTSIPDNAFKYSSGLNEVVIPSSVTTIGQYSFYGCTNLAELTIGEGVTSIGGYAFWNCPLLTTVHFNATNCTNMYTSISSGSNWSVFNTGDDTSGTSAITTITIGGNVTNIPAQAFRSCPNVTNISIPNSVVGIRKSAFYGCSGLTNVVIPNSVAQIGSYSFYGCTNLAELTMGQGLTIIGEYAFYGCSGIMEVVVPSSVATISSYAFYGCTNLVELTIGEGVQAICAQAFGECPNLATVHFNATNCTQMSSVFSNTSSGGSSAITTLTIGDNVTNIPEQAFRLCPNLTNISIPNSVVDIRNSAFYGCSGLTNIVIPNSVAQIGGYAFYGCTNLAELTIGEGVQTINDYAFWGCPTLTKVRYNATNCTSMQTNNSYSVFSINNGGANPAITSLIIGNNVIKIPKYAFKNAQNLERLIVPATVTEIGDYAFFNCDGLVLLRVQGAAMESIGNYAFYNCSNMVYSMNLPNLNYLGKYAFYNCSAITGNITIPNSMNTIEPYTFYNCSGLTGSLTIPDGITSIGAGAFYNCSGLNGLLTMPNNITSIGYGAFYNCINLTGNLIIPNNVSIIGARAFYNCSNLTGEICIPKTAASIGEYTFFNCSGLSGNLLIHKSITSIGAGAFYNCNSLTSIISECSNPPVTQETTFMNVMSSTPIYVPYGKISEYQNAIGWSVFTDYVEQAQFEQYDTDVWSDEYNWYAFELPTVNDVVRINSNCQLDVNACVLYVYIADPDYTLTIKSGQTLIAQYGIGLDNASQLIIEDGGQIIYGNGANYAISAEVNMSDAGSIVGVGIYAPFSTCNLTAIANDGYTFINWTKDGEEVSTNQTYSFLVCESGDYVANFSVNTYDIMASANPCSGGIVAFGNRDNEDYIFCDFEDGIPSGWSMIDGDGDGYTWTYKTYEGHNSAGCITSASYISGIGALSPDNYLVSPLLKLGGSITFYACAQNSLYAGEHFGVAVSTTNNSANDFTTIKEWTLDSRGNEYSQHVAKDSITRYQSSWYVFTVDLNEYNGELGYVAIRHFNCTDMFMLNIDDIMITEPPCVINDVLTHGQLCTIKAIPKDGCTFLNWTKDGVIVTTQNEYAFCVNDNAEYVANFIEATYSQSSALTSGWNWYSTYIEQENNDGLGIMEESLGHNGLTIKSYNDFTTNYYNDLGYDYWFGGLENLANESCYMIQTSSLCNVLMTGIPAIPSEHPVTIKPNWNWIGYPVAIEQLASDAMGEFVPSNEDVLKNHSDFTTYYEGYGWFPDDFVMTPGKGYLYLSSATSNKVLTYSDNRVKIPEIEKQKHHWNADIHQYADNINIIAVVNIDDSEVQDNIEVGAFVNGECRGSAILRYFEPTDRYYALLSVVGEDGDMVSFRVFDDISETKVLFRNNAVIGSLNKPYNLDFQSNHSQMTTLSLYPNPVERSNDIVIIVPYNEIAKEVLIINNLGDVIRREAFAGDRIKGIDQAGAYEVILICETGKQYHNKLIIK